MFNYFNIFLFPCNKWGEFKVFLVESNNTTKLHVAWELFNDDVGSSAIVVHFHKLPFINLLVILTSKCVRRLCLTTEKLEQHKDKA